MRDNLYRNDAGIGPGSMSAPQTVDIEITHADDAMRIQVTHSRGDNKNGYGSEVPIAEDGSIDPKDVATAFYELSLLVFKSELPDA